MTIPGSMIDANDPQNTPASEVDASLAPGLNPSTVPEALVNRGPLADPAVTYRRLFAGSIALMIATTAPLWIGSSRFPQVPFLPWLTPTPAWFEPTTTGLLLLGLGLSCWRTSARIGLGLAWIALATLIVGDQHRLQPWAYQFLLVAPALVLLSARQGLGFARLYVLILYIHSGLSKLDYAFAHEMGPSMLEALTEPLGLNPSSWSERWRTGLCLAMPGAELLFGIGLMFRWTRAIAWIGSMAMHTTLILILSPLGMDHSPNVLIWNASMLLGNLVLFHPWTDRWFAFEAPQTEDASDRFAPGIRLIFLAAAILPAFERVGWYDTWPSMALYASHNERATIFVHRDHLDAYPDWLRRQIATSDQGVPPWHRVDVTAWSRAVRGAPAYPQARARFGIAESLAAHYGGEHPVLLVVEGRADRWTGVRDREAFRGLEAIRRQADRFTLNARCRRPRRDAPDAQVDP